MKKILNFIKRKKYLLLALLALVVVIFLISKHSKESLNTFTVARTNVEQSVFLSGKVETSSKADLGFASSGRVAKIYVKNNQLVKEGQTLAQLEIGDLLADLHIKQANSQTSDVDLKGAQDKLKKITSQEDAKVANAYRNLLTEDLELIPGENNYTVATPIIAGIYDGAEGKYKIDIDKKNITIDDFTLRTSNLEKSERLINKESATPLGTRGLYISFPDNLDDYVDTTWYIEVPNKSGSSYLANYNAYVDAKNARDLAIKDAQTEVDRLMSKGDNGSSVAQAEIQKINAEIRKNTIYAPFSGKVTNIEKEVGENASVGERVISILGEGQLQIVLQVSELDVSRLNVDSEVKITLDAFGGEEFVGTLKTVNSKETTVDGVPVYEAFVELPSDARIKTGMSAKGTIILESKTDVLAIPSYYVEKVDDKNIVKVVNEEGKTEDRVVTLGLLGSDSSVEIISGLTAGEKIVAPAKK